MKSGTAAVKVGVTALAIVGIGYASFKFVSKGVQGQAGYPVWSLFRDASGLVEKSRVQVAGLNVGEIHGRHLQGTFARVDLHVKPEVELWSNAVVYKKSASLLGEYYLEIDPGTAESPDPATRQMVPNYRLRGCREAGGKENCNQIINVVEAVTTAEILGQVNETLPVLRDILRDVQKVTQGPMQQIAQDVQKGVAKNSEAAERLLNHIDEIAQNVKGLTSGAANDDLRKSIENIRDITDSVKKLVGTGEGQVNSTATKIKTDLDKIGMTLDKLNTSLDNVAEVTTNVARGHGTVGRLLKDETIADNLTDVTEDAAGFIRTLTKLQTIVGVREELHMPLNAISSVNYKTYLSLRLQPRPDKYYLIELVDDPRGNRSYSHDTVTTTDANGVAKTTQTDTYSRTSAFRVSFMFAKRFQFGRSVGLTGRLGIKESTGGVGVDLDVQMRPDGFWMRSLELQIDLFDFMSEKLPRLKVMAALEMFKHVWLTAGLDDLMNGPDSRVPVGIACGPSTPTNWCGSGRELVFGLHLGFNDEDLRALLAVGGSALAGGASSAAK